MHSTEDCVCGNSMLNRKMELTQSASLSLVFQPNAGEAAKPSQLTQLGGRGTRISAASDTPARSTVRNPDRGKGGRSEQNGSG